MRSFLVVLGLSAGALLAACSGSSESGVEGPAASDAGASSSTSTSSSSSSGGSSSGGSTSSSSGGSSGGSTSSSGGTDAGTCNGLTQLGSPFELRTTQAAVPEPQGGTIADGTYVATSGKVWGSTAAENTKFGTAGSSTIQLTGNAIQTITTGATSMKVTRRSGTFTTNATSKTISFAASCTYPPADAGAGDLQDGPYTAENGTLRLYVPLNGTGTFLELTYTKQ